MIAMETDTILVCCFDPRVDPTTFLGLNQWGKVHDNVDSGVNTVPMPKVSWARAFWRRHIQRNCFGYSS